MVGDICLDRWCTYDPATAEPSRETGIPRIGVVSTEVAPGGGGNVANNLASLGVGRAAVLGVLGDDGFAHELTRSLNARGISTDLLVRSDKVPTFTYTKLINVATGVEDLPRVDFINTQPLPDAVEQEVIEYLREFAASFDIIFVSDQADTRRGGVVTAAVRALLEEIAQADPKKIVWVDSRIRVERFRNMILKPNEREASAASIGLFGEVDYQRLRSHANSKLVFVTKGVRRGGRGGRRRPVGRSGVCQSTIRWMSPAPAIVSRPVRRWLWRSPAPPWTLRDSATWWHPSP